MSDSNTFRLDETLLRTTAFYADWPLCRILVWNDQRFPWLVAVPRLNGLRDFDDLPQSAGSCFLEEINRALRILRVATGAFKMNMAALGNISPQLHIHLIARLTDDAAWPRPIWNIGVPEEYSEEGMATFVRNLQKAANSLEAGS